jgi:hypothetical protein
LAATMDDSPAGRELRHVSRQLGVLSAVGVQPSTTKLPELTDPDVMTALSSRNPRTKAAGFWRGGTNERPP